MRTQEVFVSLPRLEDLVEGELTWCVGEPEGLDYTTLQESLRGLLWLRQPQSEEDNGQDLKEPHPHR